MSELVTIGGLWSVIEQDGLDVVEECRQATAIAERILSALGFPGREGWVDAENSGHLQPGSAASLAKQLADRAQRVLGTLEVVRDAPEHLSAELVIALAESAYLVGSTRAMLDIFKKEDLGIPSALLEAGRGRKVAQRKGGQGLAKVNLTSTGKTFPEAKEELRRVWASGVYAKKNECAAGEFERLGISLKTARTALLNLPAPLPSAEHGE